MFGVKAPIRIRNLSATLLLINDPQNRSEQTVRDLAKVPFGPQTETCNYSMGLKGGPASKTRFPSA